jgi:hypothetical protein
MLRTFARIGLTLLCLLSMAAAPMHALAQQTSTSFMLLEDADETGLDNDTIVTDSAGTASSTANSGQGGGGSTTATTQVGAGGGGRGAANLQRPSRAVVTPPTATRSSAPRVRKPTLRPAITHPAAPVPPAAAPLEYKVWPIHLQPYERLDGSQLSFFGGISSVDSLHAAAPAEQKSSLWLLGWITLAGHITIVSRKRIAKYCRKRHTKKAKRFVLRCLILLLAGLSVTTLALGFITKAYAANESTLDQRSYKGTLLDSSGHAVTSPVNIRFSYWKSVDYISTDTTSTGAINSGATSYLHWNEVLTITPSATGYFSVVLGKTNALPNLSQLGEGVLKLLSLQVEVKLATAPNTSYELLDADSNDPLVDRSRTLPVPLARNSDFLDQHDTGTGASDIPVLNNNGQLLFSTIPGGTTVDFFTIDNDNSSTNLIELKFGSSLGKKLSYNVLLNTFIFNANLEVQGSLTVTGLINGVDITSLGGSANALQASSGGGLNLNVSAGGYRLRGQITNYAGGTIGLAPNATNYVFFGSGGLQKSTSAFPTDESVINIAQVVTSAGAILSVTDRRVTQSDDRERNVQAVYSPLFEKTTYQGDGSDNVGQLVDSHDNISLKNFYEWTSTRPTLQDYDIILRVPVSQNFIRWQNDGTTNPITINYRSTSADSSNNKLDITAYDTNGTPLSFSGSTTSLASTSWSTAQLEFNGSPTWTAGQEFLLRLKVSAKDNFQMHVGSIKMNYVDLDN